VNERYDVVAGLPDVVVDRVELDPDGTPVVHATSVKGWVSTRPRDVDFPVPTRLVWRQRRWRCQEPVCSRSSFTESVPQIPSRRRMTHRLRAEAGRAVALGRTVAQAAQDWGLSWPVVHAAFLDDATSVLS
jgi:transposase